MFDHYNLCNLDSRHSAMNFPFLPNLNSLKINVPHSNLTSSIVSGPLFPYIKLPLLSILTFRNILSSVSFCLVVRPSFITAKLHFVDDLQITSNTVGIYIYIYIYTYIYMPVRLRSVYWHKHMFTFGFIASIRNQIISI